MGIFKYDVNCKTPTNELHKINMYAFFEDPEKSWRKVIAEEKERERIRKIYPQMKLSFSYEGLT